MEIGNLDRELTEAEAKAIVGKKGPSLITIVKFVLSGPTIMSILPTSNYFKGVIKRVDGAVKGGRV